MNKLLIIVAGLSLGACSTVGAPETAGQRLYAAYGAYEAASATAADYAETPTANPNVVAALRKAKDQAKPAVGFGKAYIACKGVNTTIAPMIDCSLWDFRPASLSRWAIALRAAVAALAVRN